MRVKLAKLLLVLMSAIIWPLPVVAEPEADVQVLISEVQTASDSSAAEEFVELYNPAAEAIDLSSWKIEYKSAEGTSWTTKAILTGELQPSSFYLIATENYLSADSTLSGGLAGGGGHIRLLIPSTDNQEEQVVDIVGWGTAIDPEIQSALAPSAGLSIERCFADNALVDTDDNSADFVVYDSITPNAARLCSQDPGVDDPDQDDPAQTDCQGIVISELLPNAAGSDTGNEFIELYNPTAETISLNGCGLELAGNSSAFAFGDIKIGPGGYKSFSDLETDITLPNASGGTVFLLSAENEELQEVTYPGGLDDDVAWAWFGLGDWEQTYAPTPGAANTRQPTKPCPAGQVRSETTGRCQKATSVQSSSLKPCDPDQFRNPETNRCKKKDSDSDLKPCKPGQERNPETNRCRSTSSAASKLKPCKPDQERNPATNRCRKVAGDNASALDKVEDVKTTPENSSNWWFAGIAATGVTGYGLWEWRRDLRGWLSRGWAKISGR